MVAISLPSMVALNADQSAVDGQQASPGKQRHLSFGARAEGVVAASPALTAGRARAASHSRPPTSENGAILCLAASRILIKSRSPCASNVEMNETRVRSLLCEVFRKMRQLEEAAD
jgi:hypothetical protein